MLQLKLRVENDSNIYRHSLKLNSYYKYVHVTMRKGLKVLIRSVLNNKTLNMINFESSLA